MARRILFGLKVVLICRLSASQHQESLLFCQYLQLLLFQHKLHWYSITIRMWASVKPLMVSLLADMASVIDQGMIGCGWITYMVEFSQWGLAVLLWSQSEWYPLVWRCLAWAVCLRLSHISQSTIPVTVTREFDRSLVPDIVLSGSWEDCGLWWPWCFEDGDRHESSQSYG